MKERKRKEGKRGGRKQPTVDGGEAEDDRDEHDVGRRDERHRSTRRGSAFRTQKGEERSDVPRKGAELERSGEVLLEVPVVQGEYGDGDGVGDVETLRTKESVEEV